MSIESISAVFSPKCQDNIRMSENCGLRLEWQHWYGVGVYVDPLVCT